MNGVLDIPPIGDCYAEPVQKEGYGHFRESRKTGGSFYMLQLQENSTYIDNVEFMGIGTIRGMRKMARARRLSYFSVIDS